MNPIELFVCLIFFLILFVQAASTDSTQSSPTNQPCSNYLECVTTATTMSLEPVPNSNPSFCSDMYDCFKKASYGRLVGFELKVIKNTGLGTCYKECIGRHICMSFNYQIDTGLCELQTRVPVNATFGNSSAEDQSFLNILKPNYVSRSSNTFLYLS